MPKKKAPSRTRKSPKLNTATLGNSSAVILARDAGGTASPVPGGRSEREISRTTQTGQTGRSRSGRANREQRPLRNAAQEPVNTRDAYLGDSDPKKQGIANRSAQEENRRQAKVVPFRAEN